MEPLIIVIFGASGDLTRRKLIPAIYDLFKLRLLPEHFVVLGVSRSDYDDESFREEVVYSNDHIERDTEQASCLSSFGDRLFYQAIDTLDLDDYEKVDHRLCDLNERFQTHGNYIFYMSTPPSLYETIPAGLF